MFESPDFEGSLTNLRFSSCQKIQRQNDIKISIDIGLLMMMMTTFLVIDVDKYISDWSRTNFQNKHNYRFSF